MKKFFFNENVFKNEKIIFLKFVIYFLLFVFSLIIIIILFFLLKYLKNEIFSLENENEIYLNKNLIEKNLKSLEKNFSFEKNQYENLKNLSNSLEKNYSIFIENYNKIKKRNSMLISTISQIDIIKNSRILFNFITLFNILKFIGKENFNLDINKNEFNPILRGIFRASENECLFNKLFERIKNLNFLLIIIKTDENKNFGIFINDFIKNSGDFFDNNSIVFLFNKSHYYDVKFFKKISNKKSFIINENNFFIFGENDIVIKNDCLNKKNENNFPISFFNEKLTNFELNNKNISKNKFFNVLEIEIFKLYFK